jgi:heat-inducible transcriptional repressor
VLMVLITNSGRIQQHVVELGVKIDESFISELRQKLNSLIAGASLVDVKAKVKNIATGLTAEQSKIAVVIVKNLLEQVDANRQEKIILSGTSNLAKREEDFPGSISPVLEAIEEQVVLLKLIGEMQTEQHGVSLRIGRENSFAGLANASVVVSGYENQGSEIAKLGVIGPTRMDYSTNISAVLAVARYLTKALGN